MPQASKQYMSKALCEVSLRFNLKCQFYCKYFENLQATEGGDLDGTGFQEESGIEVSERDQAAFAEFMNR